MLDNRLFLFAFGQIEGLSIIFSPILCRLFRAYKAMTKHRWMIELGLDTVSLPAFQDS